MKKRKEKRTLAEHAANVIAGLNKGVPIAKIKAEHDIGPNAAAEIMKRLEACGALERKNRQEFKWRHDVEIPSDLFMTGGYSPATKRGAHGAHAPKVAPKPRDMKEIAHSLLRELSILEPSLLLHKELFRKIEHEALTLVSMAEDVQPRVLSEDDFEKWQEFMQYEARAKRIVERRAGKK